MERNKFGHPRLKEYEEVNKNGKCIYHPSLGFVYIGNGWAKYFATKENESLAIVGFENREYQIQASLELVLSNFDSWLENAMSVIEPMEPCERDVRMDLTIYAVYILTTNPFRLSFMFHFKGPEKWIGIPTAEMVLDGDRTEFQDMGWPT